jgi:hypothetical protein
VTFRFLASFHYHRDTDLAALVGSYGGQCEVFVDSGAFSAHTLGSTVKLADYAAWLRDWQGLITTAATLDVIGDPVTTQRNTRTLEAQGLRVLPVFHVGSPWEDLEKLCAEYGYVALGGMVSHVKNPEPVMRWLVKCFRIAREHGTVFHGFGQVRFKTISALPFYSVDSSGWSRGIAYGEISLWDERRAKLTGVMVKDHAQVRRYADLLRSHGVDPTLVARPGFSISKQRPRAQYLRESSMICGAPAIAYHRFGEWLINRHHVPAPLGWKQTGTVLYLADGIADHFNLAIAHLNAAEGVTS